MHGNHKRGLTDKVSFLIRSLQVETQGYLGEKFKIWGGYSIGHCDTQKEVYTKMCVMPYNIPGL